MAYFDPLLLVATRVLNASPIGHAAQSTPQQELAAARGARGLQRRQPHRPAVRACRTAFKGPCETARDERFSNRVAGPYCGFRALRQRGRDPAPRLRQTFAVRIAQACRRKTPNETIRRGCNEGLADTKLDRKPAQSTQIERPSQNVVNPKFVKSPEQAPWYRTHSE